MNRKLWLTLARTSALAAMALVSAGMRELPKVQACTTCSWAYQNGVCVSSSCDPGGTYDFCGTNGSCDCSVVGEGCIE